MNYPIWAKNFSAQGYVNYPRLGAENFCIWGITFVNCVNRD